MIGSFANIIRIIVCVLLAISAIVILLVAARVFVDGILSSKLLYFVAIMVVIGSIGFAFDGATSQWLVQKVLQKLSLEVNILTKDIKIFEDKLRFFDFAVTLIFFFLV